MEDGSLVGHAVCENRPRVADVESLLGDRTEAAVTNLAGIELPNGRLARGEVPAAVVQVAVELVAGLDEPTGQSDCELCSGTGSTCIVLEPESAASLTPARLLTGLTCCCMALSECKDVTAPMLRATLTSLARFGATTAWAYFTSESIFVFQVPWLPEASFYVTVSGGTGMAPPGFMVTESWALASFDGSGAPPEGATGVRVGLVPRRSALFPDIRFTEGGRVCCTETGGPDPTLVTRDVDGAPLWPDVSLAVFGPRGRAEYCRPRPTDLAIVQAAARVVTHAAGSRAHRLAALPFEQEQGPILITESIPAIIYPSTSPCSLRYSFPLTPDPTKAAPALPTSPGAPPSSGPSPSLDAARLAITQGLRWLSLSSTQGSRAMTRAVEKVKEVMIMSESDKDIQRLLAHTVWDEALEALTQCTDEISK